VAGIGATQNQRPNVIGDAKGPRTVEEWFNRAVFARPTTGTFGNMGRNSLRGPGVNKWDLSLNKTFALAERTRLTFRWELFNAFNHPSFTTIGTALNTTATGVNPLLNSFAVVTGTRDARVMQLALKLNF
ncbi:MAG: carboxypeptidase regulatory-like domain-containing protein, partial [Bryobacter sp.]|nr:carboxypeptidase regulatory-like domain-containing protein [Bryobacter sp.]